jgi:uncharacterized repeat protein (TIGR01451 family)
MNRFGIAKYAVVVLAASLGSAAFAAPAGPIELVGDVKLEQHSAVGGQDKVVLVAPQVVVPGDRLVFSTSYRNTSAAAVENFVVTNPVPAAVAMDSESAAANEVSVDGGAHWGRLAALTVPDGQGARRPATAADVTHVRWVLAIVKPGVSGAVTYNAIVR